MNEIWKPVPGYEGRYEISNLGRVKSLNYLHNTGREQILKPNKIKNNKKENYMRVTLGDKTFLVHILVYKVFHGEIPEGLEVNHINKHKSDNRAVNLNLMTHDENTGYSLNKPVLCYDKNRNFVQDFISVKEASEFFGKKSSSNIVHCLKGRSKTAYGFIWTYKT